MGSGLLFRKERGRKLIIIFPFMAIILGIVSLALPQTSLWGIGNTLIAVFIFTFLLVICAVLYFTLGVKYFNHPNYPLPYKYLKIGTLSSILSDIAIHLKIDKNDLIKEIF